MAGSPADRDSALDTGVVAFELVIGHRPADLLGADDALAVDEPGVGPCDHTVLVLDGLTGVDDGIPGCPVLGDESLRRLDRVVGEDADDRQAVGFVLPELAEELRELVPARDARRSPEVDDDRPTA